MSFTGEFIKFTGLLSLAVGSTASLFLFTRFWNFFKNFGRSKEEFEELWKKGVHSESLDHALVNLSYTHKAVKNQMEATGSFEEHLLNRAIKKAEENKGILSGNKKHHMYYAASKKLKELKGSI